MKDWNYVHLIPYENILKTRNISFAFYVALFITGITLSFCFLRLVIKQTTKHLDILVHRMNMFAKNSNEFPYAKYNYSNRKDEIGIIHVQFEKMATEIQTLIDEKYKQSLLIKEAQLGSLEAQMNPHFLYNTLESINWRAKAIHEDEISNIATSLGRYLRLTVSNKEEAFTLRKELILVESYMTIQKIRFDSRLQYTQIIPEDLMDIIVPKLSIQPLLENSIHYALEQITEECYISLTSEVLDNLVHIYVKNSGSEFPENLLSRLRSQELTGSGLGIALVNIDERIKLMFGQEYGLQFNNSEDNAIAEIVIPYVKAV